MPFIFAIVIVAIILWWVLSRRYADKLGEAAEKEFNNICEAEEKKNV